MFFVALEQIKFKCIPDATEMRQKLTYLNINMALKIGYWKIRGLAQPLRLLLNYTGLQFEEKQYDDRDNWFKEDKVKLGLDFPNLPYLIDGDFKLTESSAIAKYIIKKSGKEELLGKNLEDQIALTTLLGVNEDLMKEIRKLFFDKDFATKKDAALEKVKAKLDGINKFIGEKDFTLGYLTWIDFIFAEQVHYFNAVYPEQKANFPNFWRIKTTFNNLPQIKSYYQRPTALKGPFFPPMAAVTIPVPPSIKLSYWGVRGLAQVPRLLLAYNKIEFEEYLYTQGEKWHKEDKLKFPTHFPNLPYLNDDGFVVTESTAICEYIIKKSARTDLLGKDHKDAARVHALLQVWAEAHQGARGLFFNKDWETEKVAELAKITPKLAELQRVIGEKPFAIGYLTLADFYIAQFSGYVTTVWPETAELYPFIARIKKNFNSLPEIEAFWANPTTPKLPFYPQSAFIHVKY